MHGNLGWFKWVWEPLWKRGTRKQDKQQVSANLCVCVFKWEERPASSRSLTTATKTSPLSDISAGIGGRTERTTNFPIPFFLDAWAFEWSIRQDIGPVRGQTWISIDKNSCVQCFFCLLLLLSAADDLFARSIQKREKVHRLFNINMKCQTSSCKKKKKKMLAVQYCRYIKWGLSLSGDNGGGGDITEKKRLQTVKRKEVMRKTYVLLSHFWVKLIRECVA